ncbi:[FeFe] hydrogenase H-cluster maturation GTPase HydF [Eubacterium sp.]|uniref:[FeFe] hydrogenase H-cluster maturation GTPase HydF n=1 Tax=Eubacterium sp. TaxID=142586 RepID=UPI002FC8FB59
MSLNNTPAAERVHIGIFGRRNAGKSSLINAITGQNLAIVSDVQGTTTDPVFKTMELLPLGPVIIIDTPGLDDTGELGALRVEKGRQILNKTDIAVLVVDAVMGLSPEDVSILTRIQEKKIPYVIVQNKSDTLRGGALPQGDDTLAVSALTGEGIHALKERIAHLLPDEKKQVPLVADLLSPGDFVLLVIPIDKSAPKGRLILPQQQVIRDALETGATAMMVRESELSDTLAQMGKAPRLVVTDSQVFKSVSAMVPPEIPLTSFSILFARYKGDLATCLDGLRGLSDLQDGDTILISEGCTHHRQCEDIGTVKVPRWIREYTGAAIDFKFTSGVEFPEDLSPYKLVVHCGACTLNTREVHHRMAVARAQGIPFTNYGILISHINGIVKRCVAPLGML